MERSVANSIPASWGCVQFVELEEEVVEEEEDWEVKAGCGWTFVVRVVVGDAGVGGVLVSGLLKVGVVAICGSGEKLYVIGVVVMSVRSGREAPASGGKEM